MPTSSTTKSPTGTVQPAHEYTTEIIGTGNPISVNYHDCGYSDNGPAAGRPPLTLSIFGPPTETNEAPVAVLDLADVTARDARDPAVLVGRSGLELRTNSSALNGPSPYASRSTDPDGSEDQAARGGCG